MDIRKMAIQGGTSLVVIVVGTVIALMIMKVVIPDDQNIDADTVNPHISDSEMWKK